jgi:hypothetical protein
MTLGLVLAPQIAETVHWFEDTYLKGIPALLKDNQTAFLSFLCVVAATDALAGYRYDDRQVGDRFRKFIENYFPLKYFSHARNLYLFRCRMLHNFSPAYFSLTHAASHLHLGPSPIGDTVLSDDMFFDDMKLAAERYFVELRASTPLQSLMLARLQNLQEGGAMSVMAAL